MNLLPFENIEIESPLLESEIENGIKNNIAWTTNFPMFSTNQNSHREFEGFINNGAFRIRRILKSGRNSFITIASGRISSVKLDKRTVSIKIGLNKFVNTFLIIAAIFAVTLTVLPVLSAQGRSHTTSYGDKESVEKYFSEIGIDTDTKIGKELVEEVSKSYIEENQQPLFYKLNWTALLVLIAMYVITILFYNYEASIVKDKLHSILKRS